MHIHHPVYNDRSHVFGQIASLRSHIARISHSLRLTTLHCALNVATVVAYVVDVCFCQLVHFVQRGLLADWAGSASVSGWAYFYIFLKLAYVCRAKWRFVCCLLEGLIYSLIHYFRIKDARDDWRFVDDTCVYGALWWLAISFSSSKKLCDFSAKLSGFGQTTICDRRRCASSLTTTAIAVVFVVLNKQVRLGPLVL